MNHRIREQRRAARRLCVLGLLIVSAILAVTGCTALIPHTVSTPDRPAARDGTVPVRGTVGQRMFFRVVGAVCSRGYRVEYQLDWGDGRLSAWADLEVWVNSWDRPGTFPVKARARSVQNPAVVSAWSDSLAVTILPAPPPPPPISFSGRGDTVTATFLLVEGLATFEFRHTGESNFIVWLYTAGGESVDLLVNEIGAYSGTVAVSVGGGGLFDPDPGRHLLEIRADGTWQVTIRQGPR